jgi:hypothetical protein
MVTTQTLALLATWFVLGQARLVLASKLAEHRLEAPDLSKAIAYNLAAAVRGDRAKFDPQGQRLWPWYRAISASYWALVAGAGIWAVIRASSPGGG